jgi:hypothetical protein
MIDTRNATLKDRPEALDVVGVGFASNINLSTMVDPTMLKANGEINVQNAAHLSCLEFGTFGFRYCFGFRA